MQREISVNFLLQPRLQTLIGRFVRVHAYFPFVHIQRRSLTTCHVLRVNIYDYNPRHPVLE